MELGEFSNVEELSHGGMGVVYSAYYQGKKVAIKKVRSDYMTSDEVIKRFCLEAKVISRLDHPSIVKIIEPTYNPANIYFPAFMENGELYMAMEFIDGDTIEKYVSKRGGALSEAEAVNIMCKVLDAMEYIREQGLIHRDIKPSNIIIKPDGSICIIDFGIVKDINGLVLTTVRSTMGTNGYMSPEQTLGTTVDSRTDIYSLGCVLFFMVTGQHAIEKKASDYETRIAIINNNFPRVKDYNPNVSDRLQAAILKAVDKNILKRYQTPKLFKAELENIGGTIIDNSLNTDKKGISIIVGRDPSCDIVIYDATDKVSRKHLEITCKDKEKYIEYEFFFFFSNGTEVCGTFIKGSKYIYKYFKEPKTQIFPDILLAGDARLDFMRVYEEFQKKGAYQRDEYEHSLVIDTEHINSRGSKFVWIVGLIVLIVIFAISLIVCEENYDVGILGMFLSICVSVFVIYKIFKY